MPERPLPFQYAEETKLTGLTGLGGLPTYVDFCHAMGLGRLIAGHVKAHGPTQGWTDEWIIMTLLWLNIIGGDHVDDVRKLENDEGFCRFMREMEPVGRTSKEWRAIERRWRKERTRTFPSPTAILDYLKLFHDEDQEELREPGKAFIPEPTKPLKRLMRVNEAFIAVVQRHSPESVATLDMDCTITVSHKRQALYCYKKYKGYQPLNIYWHEQGLVVYSELRDGNVPADYDLFRPFKASLNMLPQGVKKVFLRGDSATYVTELLVYCAEAKSSRFGVIEFAVGVDVTQEFKKAVAEVPDTAWKILYRIVDAKLVATGQEYAEVCFVPSWVGHKKGGPEYRYIAIREPFLPEKRGKSEKNDKEAKLPFQTMDLSSVKYKIFGVVTNRTIPGDELIWWYRERCGKSEEAHSVMKEDLAGGMFPSGLFGANAAWWLIMILALNVGEAMKRLALGGEWANKRPATIRFWLIELPARVYKRSRSLIIRLGKGNPACEMLLGARRRIWSLSGAG